MKDYILAPVAFLAGAVAYRLLTCCRDRRTRPPLPDVTALGVLSTDGVAEALRGLSGTNRTLHGQRIDREFSVVTATLALYGGTVALTYTLSPLLPSTPFLPIIWFTFVGLAFLVLLYLDGSRRANEGNQIAAEWAEDTLAAILGHSGARGFPIPTGHPNRYRWIWEVVVVITGALISAYLITIRVSG